MESRDYILQKCIKNIKEQYAMPDLSDINATKYENLVDVFIDKSHEMAADVVILQPGETIDGIIKQKFPEATKICSKLPEVTCATIDPDYVCDIKQLDGTDVGVVEGKLGVAENGCVWLPQDMRQKAVYFISENLIIILNRQDICSNMHEAYKKIKFNNYGFGTFICGPSKTADIAQILVIGAQAARSLTIILR